MKRIVPGLLIAGLWLVLLLKGSLLLFSLVTLLIVLLAADEYVKMSSKRVVSFLERACLNILIAFPVISISLCYTASGLPVGVIGAFSGLTCYILLRYKDLDDPYNQFARLLFGIVYIGFLGAHLILIRALPDGASWLIIATAITASSDSGAYFVGRAIGRKKLCPFVSPNKTVEGALGGLFSGLIAALVFAAILLPDVNWLFLISSALFLGIVGILGDLTESIIKRGTGTKDSGTILAGHGGILDRVDSLLFVGPVFYYLLVYSV